MAALSLSTPSGPTEGEQCRLMLCIWRHSTLQDQLCYIRNKPETNSLKLASPPWSNIEQQQLTRAQAHTLEPSKSIPKID